MPPPTRSFSEGQEIVALISFEKQMHITPFFNLFKNTLG